MDNRIVRVAFILALLLVAGACSGGDGPSTPQSTATKSPGDAPWSPAPVAWLPDRAARIGGCYTRGPGDYIDAIERLEGARSFRLHIPTGYDGSHGVPVVFNFHGQGRSAEDQDNYSGLIPVADTEGFILVSPEGAYHQWDILGVYADEGNDDVGAVSEILDYLKSQFCIDPGRVFATGISNGGQMAAQVGCLLPYQFAGIAPVAGIVYQGCDGPPVAVIAFHGTEDYNVPYESAPEAVREWARYNRCPDTPETERTGEFVVRESYFGCEGAPVVFYTLEGGGHTWPGAEDDTGGIGPTSHEIRASDLLGEFFRNVRRGP